MSQRRRMPAVSQAEPTPAPPPLSPESGAVPPTHDVSVPAAAPTSSRRVPRTRTGAAWVGLTAAALIAVALIVFLARNTQLRRLARRRGGGDPRGEDAGQPPAPQAVQEGVQEGTGL